jgi:hypothetical protein
MRRTAVVNQIRSLLLERGLTLPKGRSHLDEQLPTRPASFNLPCGTIFENFRGEHTDGFAGDEEAVGQAKR